MTTISELRHKLSLLDCPKEQDKICDYFKGIADLLMNKCVICKGESNYEIVEIEFYLFTPNHQDVITYPRNCKAGQWFFHQSGVDLTFETTDKQFGGILIRGMREFESGKQIFGPLNCVNMLWDMFDAFDCNSAKYPIISTDLMSGKDRDCELAARPRYITLSKGKTKQDKIRDWSERAVKEGLNLSFTEQQLTHIVFGSNYRFIKFCSIDTEDVAWKKYSAKTK